MRGTVSRPLRIVLGIILAVLVVIVLFTWVFPWVERRTQDPTVGAVTVPADVGPEQLKR